MLPSPQLKRIVLWVAPTVLVLIAFYYQINSRTCQFYGGIIHRIKTDQNVVALTFDDGPTEFTNELIELVGSQQIKATFFLVGQCIEKHPEYARRLAAAGHELGNHTYSHQRMVFKTAATIEREVERTDSLIRLITSQDEILFRPPYCKKFIGLPRYLHQHHRKTITWDVEPETFPETRISADRIAAYAVAHTKPGSIILLHGMGATNVESRKALKSLITGLKNKGYTFVTVSELLTYK